MKVTALTLTNLRAIETAEFRFQAGFNLVLVQLREATDPGTSERYTVKRYESEKATDGDSWHHTKITLNPVNPAFDPIVLTGADEQQLQVVAELVEVVTNET